MAVSTSLPPRSLAGWRAALRPLFALVLALVLSLGLAACDGSPRAAATLSDETLSSITRQAEGFLEARDRLPELAGLVTQHQVNRLGQGHPVATRQQPQPYVD